AMLARVRDEGATPSFESTVAVERVVLADPGLPGSEDARARSRALADALEARAEMVRSAMNDAAAGDARGVPRRVRTLDHVLDLFVRAALGRRLGSEPGRATQLLDTALAALAEARSDAAGGGEDVAVVDGIERLRLTARLRHAELSGDTALAADLAERRIAG